MVVLGKKKILYSAVFRVYTKTQQVVSCMSRHKVGCHEVFGFLGFINLFDLTGVRNSFAGTAGISPPTILKNKVNRCCFVLSWIWSDCSPQSLSMLVTYPGVWAL